MEKNRPYKIIISGGGTGGHIFPAIAIANAIREIHPDTEILFVGAEGKMEMEKVPQAGYKIIGLPVAGFHRKLTLKNLLFPFKLLRSLNKANKIVKEFNPDVAVGVGGYASGPLLYAAVGKKIPTLIQEQNSYAGVTNKILSKKAKTICVAYQEMDRFFPKEKIIYTGNPVRKDILEYRFKKQEGLLFFGLKENINTLFIMGGSLGARTINKSVTVNIDMLIESGVQVLWQTGKMYYKECKALVERKNADKIKVVEFVKDMNLAYSVADIVISRAGALSISELCLVGKPVILVPSPNVAEDHQTKNALALVEANAAQLINDQQAEKVLILEVLKLLHNKEKQEIFAENIMKLGKPNAAREISEEVFKLIK
ncbi:MAG TPA: undecaprenyldiphospho-muramoylpentapeptide beta-N-acetylglucosaminyltransferase [Cytophagaceae bacterium]|jgi:UDP-N-acetylglucosamine--N-acetylmuramyl-(pentapeptide) pyrophosphoryl-undecaprenol N-acetylglucosamine transferase|nr:undecaprenyldiphospho-muramoylpentapeptide beta-N-acetylglucosaminyltransferase [Cytophagaceae bacterium]